MKNKQFTYGDRVIVNSNTKNQWAGIIMFYTPNTQFAYIVDMDGNCWDVDIDNIEYNNS
jgi:hypothetical protein